MRKSSPDDFSVVVDGVGEFVYARPTIRDLIAIDKEYEKIVGEGTSSVRLSVLASMIAIHKPTCVSCPDGWDDLESLGGEHDGDIGNLLIAYREKEDSFRNAIKKVGQE